MTSETLPAVRPRRPKLPSLDHYLAPDRAIRDLGPVNWVEAIIPIFYDDPGRDQLRYAGAIRQALAKVPEPRKLMALLDVLDDALDQPPDRKVTSLAVALLFDTRVRQPANPDAYIRALEFDLVDLGFPPAVVTASCQRLRREQVFVPEIAEIVADCKAILTRYRTLKDLASRAMSAQGTARSLLARIERQ